MAFAALNRLRAIACVLLAAGVWAGCERAEPLETRVKQYWELRKLRDFAAAYEFENPDGGIEKNRYVQQMGAGNIVYVGVRVEKIREEGNEAKVDLNIVYRIPQLPKNVESPFADVWMRIGRQWYHQNPLSENDTKGASRTPGPQ